MNKIGFDALGADGLPTWTDGSPNGALRGAVKTGKDDVCGGRNVALARRASRFSIRAKTAALLANDLKFYPKSLILEAPEAVFALT